MKESLAHKLKFALWDFARQNPTLGRPIRFAGQMAMRGAGKRHRLLLKRSYSLVRPVDVYERTGDLPTQAWLLAEGATPDDVDGARLLLNHLRIPYRIGGGDNAGNAALMLNPQGLRRLLPHSDGLLSDFAARTIAAVRSGLSRPLVTGMLPPEVGLRLDDIKGEALDVWLPPMLAYGWKPNLGLFLDYFADGKNPHAAYLAGLAAAGTVEISPHAFTGNRLIFFDLPRHRSYSHDEFKAIWKQAERIMAVNNFPISSVINAHFHVLCPNAAEVLTDKGLLYFFSEYDLGSHAISPDAAAWPAGDPVRCTGRLHPNGLLQIAAGDAMGELMNPDSHYDYLMHIRSGDAATAAARLLRRLKLNLDCGFPAFATSHEFMLRDNLDSAGHQAVWSRVETELAAIGAPSKISLASLGERCRDHRTTVVWSVDGDTVTLRGKGSLFGALRLLHPAGDRIIHIPPFAGEATMQLS